MVEGDALTRARAMARGTERSDWLDVAARIGLVAYGVVHLVIAWLAVQLAVGDRSGSPLSESAGDRGPDREFQRNRRFREGDRRRYCCYRE